MRLILAIPRICCFQSPCIASTKANPRVKSLQSNGSWKLASLVFTHTSAEARGSVRNYVLRAAAFPDLFTVMAVMADVLKQSLGPRWTQWTWTNSGRKSEDFPSFPSWKEWKERRIFLRCVILIKLILFLQSQRSECAQVNTWMSWWKLDAKSNPCWIGWTKKKRRLICNHFQSFLCKTCEILPVRLCVKAWTSRSGKSLQIAGKSWIAGTVASCCVGQAAWHLLFQSRATLLRFGWRNHGKVFGMMDSTEYLPPSFARVAWLCFFDSLLKKLAATPSCCTRRSVWVLDRLLRMACNLFVWAGAISALADSEGKCHYSAKSWGIFNLHGRAHVICSA